MKVLLTSALVVLLASGSFASCGDALGCHGRWQLCAIIGFGGSSYGISQCLEQWRHKTFQCNWQRMTAEERLEACRKRLCWEKRLLVARNWIVLPGLTTVLLLLFAKFLVADVFWHMRRANGIALGLHNLTEDVLHGPVAITCSDQELAIRIRRADSRKRELVVGLVTMVFVAVFVCMNNGARLYDFIGVGGPTQEMVRECCAASCARLRTSN